MAITEFSFSVDDFENPKKYKDAEAVAVLLTRLLLLEPGTIQSHPDAGVGLYSRFAYSMQGTAGELQGEFQRQIDKYLPQFSGAKVTVKEKDKVFMIGVEINSILYGIYYDRDTSNVKTDYTKLTDL